jgi:hypothetical protein
VFVKGYKFGLMTLEFKKCSDPNVDAYYKDFLDLLDTDPKVGNDLGIIKVAFVRDSIINFMNNEIKWKYSNNFKFRGDLTKMINGKVANCLDEMLLDEDIGGFVGMFLFDSVDDIKDNIDVMNLEMSKI